MKRFIITTMTLALTLVAVVGSGCAVAQSLTYNADENAATVLAPHRAAAAELFSKSKGVLLPRLTYAARAALALDPAAMGLVVYQTDSVSGLYEFDGLAWRCLNPMEITDDSGMVRTLHRVAVTGSYKDLEHRPNIPQSIDDLAAVAFSGKYSDLKDKPAIPVLTGEDGSQKTSFAKVALTGDYLDLLSRPNIPQSIDDLSPVTFTGDYNDLSVPLPIPRSLGEYESDTLHRTIDAESREAFDNYASMSVPTRLTDLEQDYTHLLVSEKEMRTWDSLTTREVPTLLSEMQADLYTRLVTDSLRRFWDTAAARRFPSMLRDLLQDSTHRTVSEKEKAAWGKAAAELSFSGHYADLTDKPQLSSVATTGCYADLKNKLSIPSDLSTFEKNQYYQTITLSEWEQWNRKSDFKSGSWNDITDKPKIPSKVGDLRSDYEHLSVKGSDKNYWDNMAAEMDASGYFTGNYNDLRNKPTLPTRLSDLKADTAGMTVTATTEPKGQKALWEEMKTARLTAASKVFVSDYTADRMHLLVSMDDTTRWNADARRFIPDSLRHIELADGQQWCTDSLRRRWNRLSETYILSDDTITALEAMSNTMKAYAQQWHTGAETIKNLTKNYNDLVASLSEVAYSGDYNDVKNTPSQVKLIDSATLVKLDNIDKVFATTGNYYYLKDNPTLDNNSQGDFTGNFGEADFTGDPDDLKIKIVKPGFSLKSDRTLRGTTTVSGPLTVGVTSDHSECLTTPNESCSSTAASITSANNVVINSSLTLTQAKNADNRNYLSTVKMEKDLNTTTLDSVREFLNLIFPENMVAMWDESKGRIPDCWKEFTAMAGRFPVCVKDNTFSNAFIGDGNDSISQKPFSPTGPTSGNGAVEYKLTPSNLPPHSAVLDWYKKCQYQYTSAGDYAFGLEYSGYGSGYCKKGSNDKVDDYAATFSTASNHRQTLLHTLPPYFAIRFITRVSGNGCP